MAANYNNSAWFYDRASKLIYGRTLIRAQVYLLRSIPVQSKILVVGGGTGWILEEIAKIHASGLKITYVEIAPKMMVRSKKRNTGSNEVDFVTDAVENVALQNDYDVVITPFLFDNFTEESFQIIFARINQALKPNGLWLNSDFRPTGRLWQRILLKSMFLFFRMVCCIEAETLPAIQAAFDGYGYRGVEQKSFFGDFILSTVYQKS